MKFSTSAVESSLWHNTGGGDPSLFSLFPSTNSTTFSIKKVPRKAPTKELTLAWVPLVKIVANKYTLLIIPQSSVTGRFTKDVLFVSMKVTHSLPALTVLGCKSRLSAMSAHIHRGKAYCVKHTSNVGIQWRGYSSVSICTSFHVINHSFFVVSDRPQVLESSRKNREYSWRLSRGVSPDHPLMVLLLGCKDPNSTLSAFYYHTDTIIRIIWDLVVFLRHSVGYKKEKVEITS